MTIPIEPCYPCCRFFTATQNIDTIRTSKVGISLFCPKARVDHFHEVDTRFATVWGLNQPASFFNLPTSAATPDTMTPPVRLAGSTS